MNEKGFGLIANAILGFPEQQIPKYIGYYVVKHNNKHYEVCKVDLYSNRDNKRKIAEIEALPEFEVWFKKNENEDNGNFCEWFKDYLFHKRNPFTELYW